MRYYNDISSVTPTLTTAKVLTTTPTPSAPELNIFFQVAPAAKGIDVTAALVESQAGPCAEEFGLGPDVALSSIMLFSGVAAPREDIAQEATRLTGANVTPTTKQTITIAEADQGPLEVLVDAGLPVISTVPTQAETDIYGIMSDGTAIMGYT